MAGGMEKHGKWVYTNQNVVEYKYWFSEKSVILKKVTKNPSLFFLSSVSQYTIRKM